jgi:hypothetical protein
VLAAVFVFGACTPPVEAPVHAPEHAPRRAAAAPTIPSGCVPSFIQLGPPSVEPVVIAPGQTGEIVTCKLQRGDDDGDFEWRAYLVQHGPRERADRIDDAIDGVGEAKEGAASAWLSAALPDSPIVFVEHAMFAMDLGAHTFVVYRLDTDPPQLLRTFSGGEAALDIKNGAATIRTCSPTLEQHEVGDRCLAHDAQVATAIVRWTGGALAVDEHPAARP